MEKNMSTENESPALLANVTLTDDERAKLRRDGLPTLIYSITDPVDGHVAEITDHGDGCAILSIGTDIDGMFTLTRGPDGTAAKLARALWAWSRSER
jgi:hypothetical protein